VAHNFFQEPLEQKKLIKRDELNPTGFHDSEHTQNVRDWKEVFICFTQDPTEVSASHLLEEMGIRNLSNRWPQHPSSFRYVPCYIYIYIYVGAMYVEFWRTIIFDFLFC
jgi:hypothetical protein